ncbi:rho guanine nucleotide exchange factor 17-like [Anopheles ziemanni]|uniref:rho guanine nucleotide exchange factor 17-like n=1 Tax=Anopheles coustani TaxID=139045 RepID=UPI002658297E|nr:rho guanine nucleotide exchange factor 17-like [Anopheles coustani]XP_058176361.1 rho guanine nucleotide exchange factor 17-like [Anopheles ziemanni]
MSSEHSSSESGTPPPGRLRRWSPQHSVALPEKSTAPPTARPVTPGRTDNHRRRRWMILNEFIAYENQYFTALQLLTYKFHDELLKNENVLQRSKARAIFAFVPELCELHRHFDGWMDHVVRGWDERPMLGGLVGAMLEQPGLVQLYRAYVNNFQSARTVLMAELAGNELFQAFVDATLMQSVEKLNIEVFLLKPVLRMTRLIQHIREMLECTPNAHPDRKPLVRCFARGRQLADQLDNLRKWNEVLGLLQTTVSSWGTPGALLHCEDLIVEPQAEGEPSPDEQRLKRRRVYLLRDRVVSVKLREYSDSGQRLRKLFQENSAVSLKWMVPLEDVDIFVGGQTSYQPPTNVDRCNKMLHLRSDYNTIQKIRLLSTRLNHTVANLDPMHLDTVLHSIEVEIQQMNNEAQAGPRPSNPCWMQVLPKFGRPEVARLRDSSFCLRNTATTSEWRVMARLAQLALQPENTSGWWKQGVTQHFAITDPQFVGRRSVARDLLHAEISCACYYAPNIESPLYARLQLQSWLRNRNTLWVCSSRGAEPEQSCVTLFTHDLLDNTITERTSFLLEGEYVEDIVHVPEGTVCNADEDRREKSIDTVWIATRTRMLVYSAAYPFNDQLLANVELHGEPKHILHTPESVAVGLANGEMLVFQLVDGKWDLLQPLGLFVSCLPIDAIMAIGRDIYVASGTVITVFCGGSLIREPRHLQVQPLSDRFGKLPAIDIHLMEHSIHGIWIVRQRSHVVSHYHPGTFKHLQDLDVSDPVLRFVAAKQNAEDPEVLIAPMLHITTMLATRDMLLVGTNVGITLKLSLPAYANLPVVGGAWSVSYQGHLDSVNLLLALAASPIVEADTEPYGPFDISMYRHSRRISQDLENDPYASAIPMGPVAVAPGEQAKPGETRKNLSKTILFVTGGRGYRSYSGAGRTSSVAPVGSYNHCDTSTDGSNTSLGCTDSQIILWEMKK